MKYNAIIGNGSDHIKAAEILAEQSYFGFAVAHLILGAEELIKYQVVLYYEKLPSAFGEIDKVSVFKYHKQKHKLWKKHQRAVSECVSGKYLDALYLSLSGKQLEQEHKATLANVFHEVAYFFQKKGINLSDSEYCDFLQWIRIADAQKQSGLYVSIESGSPREIDRRQYEVVLKYAKILQSQAGLAQQFVSEMIQLLEEEQKKAPNP
jgi:AbiV family abortive infection protein